MPAKKHLDLKITWGSKGLLLEVPTNKSHPVLKDPNFLAFYQQVRRWVYLYPARKAETLFLTTYVEGAQIVAQEDAGLTDGTVFFHPASKSYYWDSNYAVNNLLLDLLEAGKVILIRGEEENEDKT